MKTLLSKRFLYLFFLSLFLAALLSNEAYSADSPFAYPSNWGSTGLMETPTARVLEEGKYRVGVNQISPYRYYYMTVSPFKGLEIDGRVTEILDTPASTSDPKWVSRGLFESGFYDIGVSVTDSEVWIAITNDRYFYSIRAIGIMLKVINKMLPANIKKIYLILKERGIPIAG